MSDEYARQGQDEYGSDRGGDKRLEPHRGTLVLVMGILGIFVCVICGILAWVWGNADLKKIDAGRMDPDGRGNTNVGKILGIVSVVLNCLVLILYIVIFVVFMGAAASGNLEGG
jgi:hypothetical protein